MTTHRALPSAPRPLRAYLLALLLFTPVLVLFARIASEGATNFNLIGDPACIESGVLNASRGVQYVGTYSRFGWNNPGPFYFYALLPLYLLSSLGTQSLYAGALFINLVSIGIALFCLLRSGDSRVFFWAAFCLSLYVHYYLGLRFVRNIWDPLVTVLPFAAFTLTTASVAVGRLPILPLLAISFTFLVQTRVGFVPVALWMLALSLWLCGSQQPNGLRAFVASRELRRQAGISAVLIAALWALPVVEIVRNPPGNLVDLARFFLLPSQSGQTLSDSVLNVAKITNEPLVRALRALSPRASVLVWIHPLPVFLSQIALAGATLLLSRRRGNHYVAGLLLLSLSSLPVCVMSAARIPGAVHVYLIQWMSILGLIHWCAITGALMSIATRALSRATRGSQQLVLRSARARLRIVRLAIVVVSAALLFEQRASLDDAASFETPATQELVGEISRAVQSYVEREKIDGFLISPNRARNQEQAGVLNQLNKAAVPFYVGDDWALCAGGEFRKPDEVDDTLIFTSARLRRRRNVSVVYESAEHDMFVYHKRTEPKPRRRSEP